MAAGDTVTTPRRLYSPEEAADMLDISTKQLLAEVRAGRLLYILVGKRRKFDVQDLERYIESRRVPCPQSTAAGAVRSFGSPTPSTVIGFAEARKRATATPRRS
jgi:excisionase family DNA binding protein